MFKVLIVDDEIYIVALIQKLIDWKKYDMEIVSTADNGITALDMVHEFHPDIIIVDVRMPGYDGISFMDKVREVDKQVKFIVISGHKQFDYAKGAIRNNVEDYLLKPINKEELEKVLRGIQAKLMEEIKNEASINTLVDELDSTKTKVRKTLLNELLAQNYEAFADNLGRINIHYLTHFQSAEFDLIAILFDSKNAKNEFGWEKSMVDNARLEFYRRFSPLCTEIIDLDYENMILLLINYSNEKKDTIKTGLYDLQKYYNDLVEKFNNMFITLCFGISRNNLNDIKNMKISLERCINARAAVGLGSVVEETKIKESDDTLQKVLYLGKEKFHNSLENLKLEEIKCCIREMYSTAYYLIDEDALLYKKLTDALIEKVFGYFSNIGIYGGSFSEFVKRFSHSLLLSCSSNEYAEAVYEVIAAIINENQLAEGNSSPTIRIIKRYIARHYREDISLTSAARLVNISPVYLSMLFKKEENTNFLDYLNQYRIEVSKKLLKNIKYNILEVSELSGFHSPKYFSKMFRRMIGISPSEYRKRHLGKEA